MKSFLRCVVLTGLVSLSPIALLAAAEKAPATTEKSGSTARSAETKEWDPIYIDPEDGMLDLTQFVANANGFIPLVIPITQPAVGYGAAGALVFMSKPEKLPGQAAMRPNILAVGGLATDNGTWGLFGADVRHYMDDRLESIAAAAYMNVNLDYYPPDTGAGQESFEYNMKMPLAYLRGIYRLKDLPWSTSLAGIFFKNTLSVPGDRLPPGIIEPESTSTQVGLSPAVTYDSRNNIFTPTKGFFAEAEIPLYSTALGGNADYQLPKLTTYTYVPASETVFFGLKVVGKAATGDAPFYQLPFIQLRGVAAMRYQGDEVAEAEAQVRWQFHGRFSVLGYGGYGVAWRDREVGTTSQSATTYGVGFRYEIAKGYGLHMGIDVARGPEDTILYIQFGSAWLAP